MAYQTDPDVFARKSATQEALQILDRALNGQESAGSVKEACTCLLALHGDALTYPCGMIDQAHNFDDPTQREVIMREGVHLIFRHFRLYATRD